MGNKIRTTVELSVIKLKKAKIIAVRKSLKDRDVYESAIGDYIEKYEKKNGIVATE